MESPKPSRPCLRWASREEGAGQTRKQVNRQGLSSLPSPPSLPSVAAAAAHCNHPPMLVGLPRLCLVLPCLALSCLDTPTALFHSERRHAPGLLWLPHSVRPGRQPKRVGKGRGPCSTAPQALQSGGTQWSKPKVLSAAGRPRIALL